MAERSLVVVPSWIEAHCVIPDVGADPDPFILTDAQLRFYDAHYRVKATAKRGQKATAFVYRRSQVVAPQKAGKSPLEASQICVEAVGPALFDGWARGGELYDCRDHGCGCGWVYEYEPREPMGRSWLEIGQEPLIQVTATSEEQTDNIYDALRPMIDRGPLHELIPKTGEDFIRLPGGGRIDVVTSNARSRLGQRVTFVPQDETGLWTKESGMIKVAETQRRGLSGMGGRAVEITNAWDPAENSVAQRTAEAPEPDIYRQHVLPPSNLSYANKAERHKIHRVVYAGWWGLRNLDSIEAEAAEIGRTDPAQAERFYGNRVVQGLGSWLPDGLWASRVAKRAPLPVGAEVCLGFDGSDNDDFTAIRLRTLDGWRFTPTYGPDQRPTCWNPAEWGGSIPRGEVNAAVDEICRRYKVIRAYCDPRDWQSEIGDWALRYGDKVFVEWATYRVTHMHEALLRAVTDLATGRSTHDGCPITTLHVGNARKIAKTGDRYLIGKPHGANHQKIDMAMADVLAHEAGEQALLDGWGAPKPTNYIYTA